MDGGYLCTVSVAVHGRDEVADEGGKRKLYCYVHGYFLLAGTESEVETMGDSSV